MDNLTDKELMERYYDAVECQDGKMIRKCKEEMNERTKNE